MYSLYSKDRIFRVKKDNETVFTLINEDNKKILSLGKSLKKKYDIIFTDPPYYLDEYCKSRLTRPGGKGEDFNKIKSEQWDKNYTETEMKNYAKDFKMLLKEGGNIAIFSPYHLFGKYRDIYNSIYGVVVPFIWCKTNPSPQIRKSSFLQAVEMIVMTWDKGHYFNFLKQNEMKNYAEYPICMGRERVKGEDGKTLHPTQKPMTICKHILSRLNPENGHCLDPFAGMASIGISCMELNMRYTGIEMKRAYYIAAVRRISSYCRKMNEEELS